MPKVVSLAYFFHSTATHLPRSGKTSLPVPYADIDVAIKTPPQISGQYILIICVTKNRLDITLRRKGIILVSDISDTSTAS